MPSRNGNGDLKDMVLSQDARLEAVEKGHAVHHERIGILEKTAANMSMLPSTVSALTQKVESLDVSMKREVDGLREQHKAHKEDTERKMNLGFEEIGGKVDSLVLQSATQKGWWQVLQVIGSGLVGFALILETYKALLH
jgi:hypothetical protein